MRAFLIVALMVLLCASLSACSALPESSSSAILVSCEEFYSQPHRSQTIRVVAGTSLTVDLCSNPSTGFQWDVVEISEPGMLQEVDHRLEIPAGDEPAPPGTPGREVWTFETEQAGTCTANFAYSRPWEGGEKGEWTLALTVLGE